MKEIGIMPEDLDRLVEIIQKHEDNEKVDRSWLDNMSIRKEDDNTIVVRTPESTWRNLCGRQWTFDLKKGEFYLTSMN